MVPSCGAVVPFHSYCRIGPVSTSTSHSYAVTITRQRVAWFIWEHDILSPISPYHRTCADAGMYAVGSVTIYLIPWEQATSNQLTGNGSGRYGNIPGELNIQQNGGKSGLLIHYSLLADASIYLFWCRIGCTSTSQSCHISSFQQCSPQPVHCECVKMYFSCDLPYEPTCLFELYHHAPRKIVCLLKVSPKMVAWHSLSLYALFETRIKSLQWFLEQN